MASAPHTFSIAAVDDQGARSPTVYRAFFSTTVAPYVLVESPRPSPASEAQVRPSVRITYGGTDADGSSGKPVRYVYRLFGRKNPDFPGISDFITFATSPSTRDSMRKLYAPRFGPSDHCPTCTEWQSSSADTTEVEYVNLVPTQTYLFAATGYDEAGAYDPIFSRTKNLLLLNITFAGTKGPTITMFNEFFNYSYATGGYVNDPNRYIRIEVPADRELQISWFATPPPGATMRRYRWVIDLLDLDDETPRSGPADWYHWSAWSLNETAANIGPFGPSTHLFFLEAEDNNGLVSLGIVQFTVLRPTFEKDLLIVQDCRMVGDAVINGVYQRPSGAWPNKAELDTFFYARGGFPWRGAYATLTPAPLSPPGIFNGYSFDTLSTRRYVSGIVPLALIGRYRHVIWYIDKNSANPSSGSVMALSYMSGTPSRGAHNTLATYLEQGGSAWLFGGGIGKATLLAWNRSGTNNTEYSNLDNELVQGRFMYDYAHWQSKLESDRQIGAAQLNWNNPKFNSQSPSRGYPDAPPYAKLAASVPWLTPRDRSNPADNPPPLRNPDSFWYSPRADVELLTQPNFVLEEIDGDSVSTLDTLYLSQETQSIYVDRPVMTYYHGMDFQTADHDSFAAGQPAFGPAKFVFSGFPVWFFSRPQQIALVDFVLQDIWGLQRNPAASRSVTAASIGAVSGRRIAPGTARPLRTPRALAPQSVTPLRTPGARR
jgi:hypothetical protein